MFPLQGGTPPKATLYADDVFSAYTYTGNGSTQTINNGIDLAGNGGMVWVKQRGITIPQRDHGIVDTVRGASNYLSSNLTAASTASGDVTSFNSNGLTVSVNTTYIFNQPSIDCVAWTFRKAPKFFDVVTYTGTGANRTISHELGQEVGMIYVKRTDTAADWQVYHRSLANTEYMVLNLQDAKATGATRWNSTTATTSVFSVGTDATVNASGGTYVAYLFAHDASADGIVQCGTFAAPASAPPTATTVTLGWEPQYVLCKSWEVAGDNWKIYDTSRNMSLTGLGSLVANTSAAESIRTTASVVPTATGFNILADDQFGRSQNYIYLAIRRPNKPPTTGTQVYNAIARTGTGAAATVTGVGFAPDLVVPQARSNIQGAWWFDRLRGATKTLISHVTDAEAADAQGVTSFDMNGVGLGTNFGVNGWAWTYINHFFKRAPGVFDQVCYTGTGVAKTEAHGLGVAPELWIVKSRNAVIAWYAGSKQLAATDYLSLNNTWESGVAAALWNSTYPTNAVFSLGNDAGANQNTTTYIAYLFATKAGISKVFSYTGNGSSLTVDCGFTTGARFVLIKRTDAAGDWYVWDSTRGIVAGNDPHLSLNTSAAEVTTDDSVDTDTTGFIVNQVAATSVNVTSATYIGLAFA